MNSVYKSGVLASTADANAFLKNHLIITGSIFWVDSVTGSGSGPGTEDEPYDTLAGAVAQCTANNGDVIVIKSTHEETLTTGVTLVNGLKVFGIGTGSARPKFTVNAAITGISLGGREELYNIYFPAATASNTSIVTLANTRPILMDCYFECGANNATTIEIASNAANSLVDSCVFQVTADGPNKGIYIGNALTRGAEIVDCSFDGNDIGWDDAAVYSDVAHLAYFYSGNTLSNNASIVHTAAAKGWVSNTVMGSNSRVEV